MEDTPKDFLTESSMRLMEREIYRDVYTSQVYSALMRTFKTEIIRYWEVTDVIFNGVKTIIKWEKRLEPLTDAELFEKYGRETALPETLDNNNT